MQPNLFQTALVSLLVGASCLRAGTSQTASASQETLTYTDATAAIVAYTWTAPPLGSTNSLGKLHISAQESGHAAAELDLPIAVQPSGATLRLAGLAHSPAGAAMVSAYQLQFTANSTPLLVTVTPSLAGRLLTLDITSDKGVIGAVISGVWPASEDPKQVAIPYYTGSVSYLAAPEIFANLYFDWQRSRATQLYAAEAVYSPLTNGTRNAVQEALKVSVSGSLADVMPDPSHAPSPYLAQLAGRTVLDLANGTFSSIAQTLNTLGDYGLQNCVVIIHNWQRSGYDNALPAQYPASDVKGGGAELQQAVAAGQKSGCYVGLHENYVDYYPNYDYFSINAIARDSQNGLKLSYFNAGRGLQSYATRPTLLTANAATQSPEIHSLYQTNASYIDVNSSVSPWWRTDMDASVTGAGTFAAFRAASAALWSFERTTHGGPVFGEGGSHWFWSGLLDGVEAEFGGGAVPNHSSSQAPLFVDFDLLKIHPRQVNYGMGDYRHWIAAGQDITTRTDLQDAYRMQEIIYGHAPFVGTELWSNTAWVLLEQNLVSPVAQRYGTQNVTNIQYQINGVWADSHAAVLAKDWSRVKVTYGNGDQIVANGQALPLQSSGLTLPQFGWESHGRNLSAYTALRNGMVADYAQTDLSYLANARNASDLQASGKVAQAQTVSFQQTGPGSAQMQVQWRALDWSPVDNLLVFVNFVSGAGVTVFKANHWPVNVTSGWMPGQAVLDTFNVNVPASVPDGTYSVRIGLDLLQSATHFPLEGTDDGSGSMRYIIGGLVVSGGGTQLAYSATAQPAVPADSGLNGIGSSVDFGAIRTDGMVSIVRDGDDWVLRVYPRWRAVAVQLSAKVFSPAGLTCDIFATSNQPPTLSQGYWQVHTNGAKVCRWPAN